MVFFRPAVLTLVGALGNRSALGFAFSPKALSWPITSMTSAWVDQR